MTWRLEIGDSAQVLTTLPDCSVDALVTDPPAGISFMSAKWDHHKGGRDAWIDWMAEIMRECLRVMKPGAHGLVWALPRTSHWTGMALELSGFEVRDRVTHLFGNGFPKSLNLGDGTGTALKPSCEDWWLVRRPLDGTVARNVAKWGTGGLRIDDCRIGDDTQRGDRYRGRPPGGGGGQVNIAGLMDRPWEVKPGRWPAHTVFSHSPGCVLRGERRVKASHLDHECHGVAFSGIDGPAKHKRGHADADGKETVPDWECAPNCAVAELDRQSGELTSGSRAAGARKIGMGYHGADGDGGPAIVGNVGGASRFYYCAKPSTAERNAGLESLAKRTAGEVTGRKDGSAGLDNPRAGAGRTSGARNLHPTVKSLDLMQWLIRLITPRGGTGLDPFAGSGSTLVAALREGCSVIGIEQSPEYAEIARLRVEEDMPLFSRRRES